MLFVAVYCTDSLVPFVLELTLSQYYILTRGAGGGGGGGGGEEHLGYSCYQIKHGFELDLK